MQSLSNWFNSTIYCETNTKECVDLNYKNDIAQISTPAFEKKKNYKKKWIHLEWPIIKYA